MGLFNKFFEKINFNKLDEFQNTEIEKIVVHKLDNYWTLYLKNNNPINPEVIDELITLSNKGFDKIEKVEIVIKNENTSDDDVLSYFKYHLNKLTKECPSLCSLNSSKITSKDGVITLEVANIAEEKRFLENKERFINTLRNLGINISNILTIVNRDKGKKVRDEIEKIKNGLESDIEKIKPTIMAEKKASPVLEINSGIIFGNSFKTDNVLPISSLTEEKRAITIKGKIIDIRSVISQKSDYKIFTIEVSDNSSITCKLFTKENDVFNFLKNNLKEGKTYYFKGSTQNDSYLKRIVFNIRSIMDAKDVKEEVKTNDFIDYGYIPEYIPDDNYDESYYNDNAFFIESDDILLNDPYKELDSLPKEEKLIKELDKSITKAKEKNNITFDEKSNIVLGTEIKENPTLMKNCTNDNPNVVFEAKIFDVSLFESSKNNFKIVTLKITDKTDSFIAKIFTTNKDEYNFYAKKLKPSTWIKISGQVRYDDYSNDLVLNARNINIIDSKEEKFVDDAPVKRVELHAHTKMSQMDGMLDTKEYIDTLYKAGYKALAITDHNAVQSFPDAFNKVKSINKGKEPEDKFKVLYGCELTMIEDSLSIVTRPIDKPSIDATYCVFDLETTGFNAGGADSIIEIGAVLIKEGKIIDRFDELINPGRVLPAKITQITGITDEMLEGKDSEENVVKKFLDFAKDYPLIAHNARFDTSFIEMAFKKYDLGEFNSCVIDTLELSKALDTGFARHSLSAIVKRYNVEFDEDKHHRADYDAEATALVFAEMLKKMYNQNIENINNFNDLIDKTEIYKYGTSYHINLLVKNKTGLKNLFKLVSLANTKYLYKTPRILRSEIEKHREGLLIGSCCYESEVFREAKRKSDEELSNLVRFYDYVEVQPREVYHHLIETSDFLNEVELTNHIKKIVEVCSEAGVLIAASGDVHHFDRESKIYREIIINQKVPGGGRHPLNRSNITTIPSQHFRTTNEMLDDFSFLDEKIRETIVITNTNKIADMCEDVEVIIDTKGVPFAPKMDNSVEIVKDMVYKKAKSIYGDPLPKLIDERIENELNGIIKGGYDVIYLIAQKLVEHSNKEGYLVGSRGSVGSSFVAAMMNITEINPLPAHYICEKCKTSLFEVNGKPLSDDYTSGYDLPDMVCPNCHEKMNKEGQDMPFATFLGFNADKVPDIDLNFSGDNQASAHEYTKVLFGKDNVYRAGIVSTVADKTAYGFVKGYCEDKGITMKSVEIERLAKGVTGVKRTTGQHPGGIIVIPDYMEVFDFTPFQYPADDINSAWRTTHFDFHSIEDCVLKLDILGHDNPTVLKMLQDLSGLDVLKVPLDDKETMSLFTSPKALGVTEDKISCPTGTLGVPEFGTSFVIRTLTETKPKTFAELIKISGLSHGTDVWTGNARDLILNNVVPFKDIIGCRDDIMNALLTYDVEPLKAFKIMEFVRKGKASKDKETWAEYKEIMEKANVPEWFITSCGKIKYMFPKAHAAAYVVASFRIAWFKVHKPLYFYATYYSVRTTDFDIEVMCKDYKAIKKRYEEIIDKGYEATQKEVNLTNELQIAMEMYARGYKFKMIDLYKSDARNFVVDEEEKALIFPFRGLDGLGENVAKLIVKEREKHEFLSIEDLQTRAKVNSTTIEKMKYLGILDGMSESNQLSLFD